MGVKFGKFHPHRCNVSPPAGRKTSKSLSKLNTGRLALRAMLPVITARGRSLTLYRYAPSLNLENRLSREVNCQNQSQRSENRWLIPGGPKHGATEIWLPTCLKCLKQFAWFLAQLTPFCSENNVNLIFGVLLKAVRSRPEPSARCP